MTQETELQTAASLAKIEQQVVSICDRIDELKAMVENVGRLDVTVAKLVVGCDNTAKSVDELWHKTRRMDEDVNGALREAHALKDQIKGAAWIGGLIFGFIQVALLATLGWAALQLIDSSTQIQLIKQRIDSAEQHKGKP